MSDHGVGEGTDSYLLEGITDPVGYAGLLADVALVASEGVVILCHGTRTVAVVVTTREQFRQAPV